MKNKPSSKETPVVMEEDESAYKHTMEAIAAITEEDLEFFTPPEDDPETEDSTEVPKAFPMIFSLNDEPMPAANTYSSAKLGMPPQLPTNRMGKRGSIQFVSRRSSLHAKLVRSSTMASFQLGGNVFGSNKESVERILKRMATAIQKDLKHQ